MQKNSMHSENKSFSRREWWLLIAVLLMIEYWIFSVSYTVSGQDEIVSYVSFAATIASILLALIAIIYSFVQADSQQKSAESISFQVDELSKTSNLLATSRNELQEQLDRVSEIAGKVDVLHNFVDVRLGSLQESLANMKNSVKPEVVTQNGSANAFDKGAIARRILSETTFSADMMTYAIAKSAEMGGEMNMHFVRFVGEYFAKPLVSAGIQKAYGEALGVGVQIMSTLRAFSLVSTTNNSIKFDAGLVEFCTAQESRLLEMDAGNVKLGCAAILKVYDEKKGGEASISP